VRAIFLALTFLAGAGVLAADRPVRGPEILLGDATLAPLPYNSLRSVVTATNGDQSLALWTLDSTLYAMTIDRNGNFLTPFPKALLHLPLHDDAGTFFTYAAWLDGSYAVFANRSSSDPMMMLRVTPELEILEQRAIDVPAFQQLFDTGDELLVMSEYSDFRVGRDFSVIARMPHEWRTGSSIVQTPDGPMLAIASAPAITLWPVDGGGYGIRIVSAGRPRMVRMVWTGSGYAAVWTDCAYGCVARMATFDEQLRAVSGTLELGASDDDVAIFAVGDDIVLVAWEIRGGVNARWLRGGIRTGSDMFLGVDASLAQLADGRVLSVSRDLETRIVPPPGANTSRDVPVVATAQTAGYERAAAVAASATQLAIARQQNTWGHLVVSILDGNGNQVREIPLYGFNIALASDGTDLFALYQSAGTSWLQRLAGNARPAPLPYPVLPVLHWTGEIFVTVQSESHYVGRTLVRRTWVRWLDRDGVFDDRRCASEIVPATSEIASIVPAGDAAWIFTPSYWIPLKHGCPDGAPQSTPYQYDLPKVAWRGGTWASLDLTPYLQEYVLQLSRDVTAFDGRPHDAGLALEYKGREAVLAALPSRWMTGGMSPDGLRVTAFDDSGAITGSTVIAEQGRVDAIVPLGADRAMVVYTRPVFEPPYAGAQRVFAAPLTFENVSRRRGVSP
jgi:hypothetical protein